MKVKIYETNEAKKRYWEPSEGAWQETDKAMYVVNLYPEVEYQYFRGFGGAFTESAAHVYAGMGAAHQKEMVRACYGEDGLRYRFGRVHINSCDFALGNYTYIEEGDEALETFDISHDVAEILPLIYDAQQETREFAGEPIIFLASPWSPPAFMKTNHEMNNGGKLLDAYREAWAQYYVKFIRAYEEKGVSIRYITVQNEAAAVQTWDSCLYSAREEGLFVRDYLGPALAKGGLSDVGIFVWDHNKDQGYERLRDSLAVEGAEDYIAGCALHWYTGDHFDAAALIKKQFPTKEVFFSEGCVEYSRFADSGETSRAEMYAHDIIGNLNAGISASIDWNLFLDAEGGPNHAGNFCAAPIMCDPAADVYEKRLIYYYIGQFSRFIEPGAVRIGTTKYTDALEVTAFRNPNGSIVAVLLNRTDEEQKVVLKKDAEGLETALSPHTIMTFCID